MIKLSHFRQLYRVGGTRNEIRNCVDYGCGGRGVRVLQRL